MHTDINAYAFAQRCQEFRQTMRETTYIEACSPLHLIMHGFAQRALALTAELNRSYDTPENVTRAITHLMGRAPGEGFALFPRFIPIAG